MVEKEREVERGGQGGKRGGQGLRNGWREVWRISKSLITPVDKRTVYCDELGKGGDGCAIMP